MTAPNTALLRRTLAWIEEHPDQHDQTIYRCGTGMCVAGWACQLDGGLWAAGPDDAAGELLVAVDDDPDKLTIRPHGVPLIHVNDRARRILGLTRWQATRLFESDNSLEDIRRLVGEICTGAS